MNECSKYGDQQLIKMIVAGGKAENTALKCIMDANRGKIRALVARNQGHQEDAEEVLCNAAMTLRKKLIHGEFRGDSRLATFFYGICKFKWMSKLNGIRNRRKKEFEVDDFPQGSADQLGEQIDFQDLIRRLDRFMQKLPGHCRNALALAGRGYSNQEIADELSYKDAQNARNAVYRCRQALFELIGNDDDFRSFIRNRK